MSDKFHRMFKLLSMKRSDVPAFKQMLVLHHDELEEALKNDKEFTEAAFLYEMDNHEYAIMGVIDI